MEHLKKYWIAYTALAIGLIVLAMNWKNWFGSKNGNGSNGTIEPGPRPVPTADIERKA